MTETRPQIAGKERGPGPGRYFLPSTLGYSQHDVSKKTQPAYSFGRRLDPPKESHRYTPGPAYFVNPKITRTGMDGTPCYSMLARREALAQFKTPSPGAYHPESVHPQGEKHAPRYSIGFRTRIRRADQNPAPNSYLLPKIIGPLQPYKESSASYSMTARSNIGCYSEDLAKAPGPGHVLKVSTDVYMEKAPLYSLRSKNFMPGDTVKKPGPGAHRPENVIINRRIAPKYSLAGRHSEFTCPLITE